MKDLKFIFGLTLTFMFIVSISVDSALSKIKSEGRWFIDEYHRAVMFHGFNAVNKEFPWLPDSTNVNLKNESQLMLLKKWGFNSVRLGFMWAGLYPEKGKINQTYVNEMIKIIKNLEKYNIYVILELHQDMMSTKFASYDGFPLWFLNELPNSKFKFPWPLTNKSIEANIFASYITEACGFAFQCLYDNVNNVQEYFFQYWRTISQIFSEFPSVLAYELINEPWAGNIYENPFLLLPGIADKVNLLPLYDKTYEEIRKYDKEKLVFYEPVTWGLVSSKDIIGTGFNRAPGNDSSGTVLSWHFYCWLIDINPNLLKNGTYPNFVPEICNDWQLNSFFKAVDDESKKLGGTASFLTEFGICAFRDQVTHQINLDACKFVLDGSDVHMQSWTYWESNFFSTDTEFSNEIVNTFSRVYPMITNGRPKAIFYNSTTKYFSFTYQMAVYNSKQASLTTEIFVPEFMYPQGFDVYVSSELQWTFNKNLSRVIITLKKEIIEELNNAKKFEFATDLFVSISSNKDK